jgi:hypothetical protein
VILNTNDGALIVHRDECVVDYPPTRQPVEPETARELLDSGKAYECPHCSPRKDLP